MSIGFVGRSNYNLDFVVDTLNNQQSIAKEGTGSSPPPLNSSSREKIVSLVLLLKEAETINATCVKNSKTLRGFYLDVRRNWRGSADLYSHLRDTIHRINALLNTCEPSTRKFSVSMDALHVIGQHAREYCDVSPIGGITAGEIMDFSEGACVEDVLVVANEGHLELLRVCECGKWFFARRRDSRACSVKCRKQTHEKSPEYRRRRAEYMRDRRSESRRRLERRGRAR